MANSFPTSTRSSSVLRAITSIKKCTRRLAMIATNSCFPMSHLSGATSLKSRSQKNKDTYGNHPHYASADNRSRRSHYLLFFRERNGAQCGAVEHGGTVGRAAERHRPCT